MAVKMTLLSLKGSGELCGALGASGVPPGRALPCTGDRDSHPQDEPTGPETRGWSEVTRGGAAGGRWRPACLGESSRDPQHQGPGPRGPSGPSWLWPLGCGLARLLAHSADVCGAPGTRVPSLETPASKAGCAPGPGAAAGRVTAQMSAGGAGGPLLSGVSREDAPGLSLGTPQCQEVQASNQPGDSGTGEEAREAGGEPGP